PVLLPQLFTRGAIELNRRRALGVEKRRSVAGEMEVERPSITFAGIDMQAYFHRVEIERIVQSGITQAESIEQLDRNLSTILAEVSSQLGVTSTMEYYRAIADILPLRLPERINQMALDAAMRGDVRGANALLFLNMKTILSVVRKLGAGIEEEDLIQS